MADIIESDVDRETFFASLTDEQREVMQLVEDCFQVIYLLENHPETFKIGKDDLEEICQGVDDALAFLVSQGIMLISPPTFEMQKGRN